MSTTVLKVSFDGDIRRLPLHRELTFHEVMHLVMSNWLVRLPSDKVLRLTYTDDEGDACTLTPETFEDFLTQHGATIDGFVMLGDANLGAVQRPLRLQASLAPKVRASKATYLKVFNNSPSDCLVTVDSTNNDDWDGVGRPDKNFQRVSIGAFTGREEREELNVWSSSAWFTMHITFANDDQIEFRNDQHDAYSAHHRTYTIEGPSAAKYSLSQWTDDDHNYLSFFPKVSTSTWMSKIDDSLQISDFTIPGTHDSCSFHDTIVPFVQTQKSDLLSQLNSGIRFIDIRCRHINDTFAIHHEQVYLNMNFDDVLKSCKEFLMSKSSETILMCVKEEYDSQNITRSFQETFQSYVDKDDTIWYLDQAVPTLGAVRGKIVLFRRFQSSIACGIDVSCWPDNTTFTEKNADNVSYHVQDCYKVDVGGTNKMRQFMDCIELAKSGPAGNLYIDLLSGWSDTQTALIFANIMNPALLKNLMDAPGYGRRGILLLDDCNEVNCLIPQILSYNQSHVV